MWRLAERLRELRETTGESTTCGWMPDEACLLLYALVRWFRPQTVIQTGHLWGKSALFVLEALATCLEPIAGAEITSDQRFNEAVQAHTPLYYPGRLISVDPWCAQVPNAAAGRALLTQWYGDRFEWVEQASYHFWDHLPPKFEPGRLFGIVDADHSEHGTSTDIAALVRLNALCIVVDDTAWIEETARACGRLDGYQRLVLPQYQGLTFYVREGAL